jgi:exosortase
VTAALLLYVYWGVIRHILVARWLGDGNWSHGWLIPVFSLYFVFTQREALGRCHVKPSYVGAVILAGSLGLYFVGAFWLHMAYPQGLSLVGALFGVTLLLAGWGVMRVAWFPILFLLFAVPLPHDVFVALTAPLQRLASTVTASLLPLFVSGLHTDAQAVVIDYMMPGRQGTLNVDEACSGMRSLMAFVTLGVAIAYLGDRPQWQRVVMVLMCLPIAVFCNVIRVLTTGLLHVTGHEQLARGTAHELLGILMFGVALALYALLGYVLAHLFVEAPAAATAERQ